MSPICTHFRTTNMWRFTWVRTPLSKGVRLTSVNTGLRYSLYTLSETYSGWYRCQWHPRNHLRIAKVRPAAYLQALCRREVQRETPAD